MNEEAFEYAYSLFTQDGYTGTIDDYRSLVSSDTDAVSHSYELFKKDKYSGSREDFEQLLKPEKKNQVDTVEETSDGVEEVTESLQKNGSSDSLGQEDNVPKIKVEQDVITDSSINGIDVEKQDFDKFVSDEEEIKKQTEDPFSYSMNIVDEALINGSEENAVPLMNYHFNQYGFKFKESDILGDGMVVSSASLDENGKRKELRVNLDPFSGFGDKEEKEALQNFLNENKENSRKLQSAEKGYANLERKITDQKGIDSSLNSLNTKANVFRQEVQGWLKGNAELKKRTEFFDGLSQDEINDPKIRDAFNLYISDTNKSEALKKKILATESELRDSGRALDQTMGRYSEMKSASGNMSSASLNAIWSGIGRMGSSAMNYVTDFIVNTGEFGGASPIGYKKLYMDTAKKMFATKKSDDIHDLETPNENNETSKGKWNSYLENLTDEQKDKVSAKTKDILAKDRKFDIYDFNEDGGADLKEIPSGSRYSDYARKQNVKNLSKDSMVELARTAPVKSFGDDDASVEYSDLVKEGFWGGAYLGLMESLPAMAGPSGKAGLVMRTASMFGQVSDHVNEEMFKNPEFADISENEKLTVAIPLGITVGVLETIGFRNVVQQKGLINKVLLKAIGKYTGAKQVSKRGFTDVVRQEVDGMLARGVLTLAAGGVAEFETGAAQEIADIGIKAIYNGAKEKDMFQTPESIKDGINQVLKAGAQEMVGGWIMSTPGAMINAATSKDFTRLDNGVFEVFEDMIDDGTSTKLINIKLKEQINAGVITASEAKEQEAIFNKLKGVYTQIPSDYSTDQKKKALGLLLNRQGLEQSIEGKDDATVKPVKRKIDEINDLLEEISNNAYESNEATTVGRVEEDEIIDEEIKLETPNPEKDGIQEQGTDGVDAKEPTGSSEEIEPGTTDDRTTGKSDTEIENESREKAEKEIEVLEFKEKDLQVKLKEIAQNGTSPETENGQLFDKVSDELIEVISEIKKAKDNLLNQKENKEVAEIEEDIDVVEIKPTKKLKNDFKNNKLSYFDRVGMLFAIAIKKKNKKKLTSFEDTLFSSSDSALVNDILIEVDERASSQSQRRPYVKPDFDVLGKNQEEQDQQEAEDFDALLNPDSKVESDIDNLPTAELELMNGETVKINQESKNLVFTKKGKDASTGTDLTTKILKQAQQAAKAIAKIFPSITIMVHRDSEIYDTLDPDKNSRGLYDPATNTVHINLTNGKADSKTVAHEVFHAVLLNKLKMNNKAAIAATKKMVQALSRSKTLDKNTRIALKNFASNYDTEVQNEETLAEIIGMISDNYLKLEPSSKTIVRKWIEKIADKLGLEIGQSENDVVDLLNVIASKVMTGTVISDGDLSFLDNFEGGKDVKNPINALKKSIVGNFEISYTEDSKITDYLKNKKSTEKRITQPVDLEFMRGLSSALQSPDDMMVGQLKYKGKVIFEGQGGIFFVTKFGAVWASGDVKTAKTLADMINRSVKENGGKRGFLTLTKGTDAKLVSSASGVNSTLAILETMLDEGLITPSAFRSAISTTVSKAGGKINLRQSAKDLKTDVDKYFSDSTTSTFAKRGVVVNNIVTELAKSLKADKAAKVKIIEFLGGDTSKGLGAGVTAKSQSLVDLIAKVVGEKLVKGLNTGDVYAVIEVEGEVEAVKGDHKSYKGFIKQKNGNPPILHLIQKREHGREYITRDSGKVYTGPAVATNEFVTYNLSKNINSKNELTLRKQKTIKDNGKPTTKEGNRKFNEPLQDATTIANRVAERTGINYEEATRIEKLDIDRAREIAQIFEQTEPNPNDKDVKESYEALIDETIVQYEEILDGGYLIEINNDEPYLNSNKMIDDLRQKKNMRIFSTEAGFGDGKITDAERAANPLLAKTKFKDKNGVPLLANDIFRFVHDFFGHAKMGNGFGPIGEENAWNVHSRMYTELARGAMTTETRGQNSWVNFSGANKDAFILRDAARKLRKEGRFEEALAKVDEAYDLMRFADQKVMLMPKVYTLTDSEISNTPEIRKQKEAAEKLGILYKMNTKGFMPSTIPLGPLQQSAKKLGLRVERALFREGYNKGKVAGYYFSNGITSNGKPRFYNPRVPGARKQKSMSDIGLVNKDLVSVIRIGRENNIKDNTIVDYLKRKAGFLMSEIKPLMSLSDYTLENFPSSFGNIEGGLQKGMILFDRLYNLKTNLYENNLTKVGQKITEINDKIELLTIQDENSTELKNTEKIAKLKSSLKKVEKEARKSGDKFYKFTTQEINNKIIEALENSKEYKDASNKGAYSTQQAKMMSQMMNAFEGPVMRGDAAAKIKMARQILRERTRGTKELQKVKRDLRNFIRVALPKFVFAKPEVIELINTITNANLDNIENLKVEVLEFVNKRTNIELTKQISKILDGKYDDVQSGRRKGYKVDEITRKRLTFIKDLIKGINTKSGFEEITNLGQEFQDRIDKLEKSTLQTPANRSEIADLNIALNFINAQLSEENSIEKTSELQDVAANLIDLVNIGKSTLEASLRAKHMEYIDSFQKAFYEITGKKVKVYVPNPEYNELQPESNKNTRLIKNPEHEDNMRDFKMISDAKKSRVTNRAKAFFSSMTEGAVAFVIGHNDLVGLMSKIGKMPGEIFGGDLQDMVSNKIDDSTNDYKSRKMATTLVINNKLEEVYGKKWRAKGQKDSKSYPTGILLHTGVAIADLSQNQMGYLVNQYKDPANKPSFKNKYGEDYVRIMAEMESKLNDEVAEIGRWQIEEFFPSLYEGYNDVYKKVYRTSMPWNEHYAGRIYREGRQDKEVPSILSQTEGAYKGFASPASTKERVSNKLAIKDMDQMAAMMTYVNDMNYFAGYGENLNDIAKIFSNDDIVNAITSQYGKGPMKSIDTMIQKLSNRGVQKEYGMEWINNVTSAFVIGRLAINPTIFIKQLTSAPAYAVNIGFRNWMKQAAMGIPEVRSNWKEISENSIYIQDRYGSSILRTLETYAPAKVENLIPTQTMGSIIDTLMYLVKQGDKGAIVVGGIPNYAHYKAEYKKSNPVATEQEVIDYAIKKFERDTKRSQQSSDLQDKDQFQTGNPLSRTFNMFQTSVKQYLRKEMTTTRNLYRKLKSGGKEGKGTYWENLKTLTMYHSVLPVIFQYISAGLPGVLAPWEDEDENDLIRAATLGNINGLFIIGEMFSAFGDFMTDKPWTGDETTIPVLSIGLKFFAELNKGNQYNVTQFDKNGDQRTPESVAESIAGQQAVYKKAFFNLANAGLPVAQLDRLVKNADKIMEGNMTAEETILRALQFSDYAITTEESRQKAKEKPKKARVLTLKQLEKYNPEAFERKMEIKDKIKNSDMYLKKQELKRMQKERREAQLEKYYNR